MHDILSVAEELLRADTLKSSAIQEEKNPANNLWEIGCQKIMTHEPLAIGDYLFGRDYGKGGREMDVGEESIEIQDTRGAFEHDPDIMYEENEPDEQQEFAHTGVEEALERARRDLEERLGGP